MAEIEERGRNRLEEEGVPDLFDAVNQDEGMVPPADQPKFSDAVGVTAREERTGETVRERAAQEVPDRTRERGEPPAGRLVTDNSAFGESDAVGPPADTPGDYEALSAEEAAVRLKTRERY